ncbi:hypothetical protein T07_9765 [Trichinella nelsoni]|uniref:Uncharacterized protein n=1 Tax=Trichinella nelsoni TaxID=6336 RepID=A0A0V0RDI0_9BILA|nr:hypothetical protein T07_9765 [Trichinella nelsoni]
MCIGLRGCRGKLYTNLDATQVIQTCEHADGRRVDPDTLYQQLNELKRPAAEDRNPVTEIYDDLANNASTSADTAAYFPSWDQTQNTMCTTVVQYRDTHNFWLLCGCWLRVTASPRIGLLRLSNPGTKSCLTFLRLIIDEQGKTESAVQQMDDDYTRETGFVRSSAAYGFQK